MFLTIGTDKEGGFLHSDTYGIVCRQPRSIPCVSDGGGGGRYHLLMAKSTDPWATWGRRFRDHVKKKGWTWARVAEMTEWSESTLRSWTNGTRSINLVDFFALCKKTEADPALILFGTSTLNSGQRELLRNVAKEFGASDTLIRQ